MTTKGQIRRELFWVIELFCVLIVVVAIRIYNILKLTELLTKIKPVLLYVK